MVEQVQLPEGFVQFGILHDALYGPRVLVVRPQADAEIISGMPIRESLAATV